MDQPKASWCVSTSKGNRGGIGGLQGIVREFGQGSSRSVRPVYQERASFTMSASPPIFETDLRRNLKRTAMLTPGISSASTYRLRCPPAATWIFTLRIVAPTGNKQAGKS